MDTSVRTTFTTAKRIAGAAGAVALASMVVWIIDLATRPPCPPNYVRLLDIERPAPFVAGAIMIGCAVTAAAGHRGRRAGLVTTLAVLLALASLISLLFAIGAVVSHRGQFDNTCWTF